jgi:hypothetical protein
VTVRTLAAMRRKTRTVGPVERHGIRLSNHFSPMQRIDRDTGGGSTGVRRSD